MEQKKAGILGTVLGAIPYLGGAISGWVDPLKGLSRGESSSALSEPSIVASAAAPLGMMFGKLPRAGSPKQMVKELIMKSLVASAAGSGLATAASRFVKDRHFPKSASDLYFEGLQKEAFGVGDAVNFTKDLARSMYIDPAKNIFKDSGDAIKAVGDGDFQHAAGRAMSAAGNALWTGMNVIPGASLLGRGIKGTAAAVGEGVGLAKNLENAGAIGAKITERGARIGGAMEGPMKAIEKTKGTLLGGMLGQGWLKRDAPGMFSGLKQVSKGTLAPSSYLAERGRRAIDTGVWAAPTFGLNIGGDIVSDSSPTKQMEYLKQDPQFSRYLGRGLMDKIKMLPSDQQVIVYRKLKEKGLLDSYNEMISNQTAG